MIIDYILSQLSENGVTINSGRCHYCMISSNRGLNGNDLIFLFPEHKNKPSYVIKIGRTPENSKALINEFNWIKFLGEHQKGLSKLPIVYFLNSLSGHVYFVQSIVEGIGLDMALLSWGIDARVQRHLDQAIDFLVNLQGIYPQEDAQSISEASRIFEEHLKDIGADPAQITQIRKSANAVGLTSCLIHGDFWVTNVLVDKKRSRINGIIDFEYANDFCYTYFDIFWFVITLSMFTGDSSSSGDLLYSYKNAFFFSKCMPLYSEIFEKYFKKLLKKKPPLFDLFVISLLYGAFRGKGLFGHSTDMDEICRELLFWSIDNESEFNLH